MNISNIVNNELYIQKILSVVQKQYDRDEFIEPQVFIRNEDLMICVLEGESFYAIDGKEYYLKAGDVLFLPYKSQYMRHILSPHYQTLLIYFRFTETPGITLTHQYFPSIQGIDLEFMRLLKRWNSRGLCTRSECMCIFYEIYMRLLRSGASTYLTDAKRDLFESAVQSLMVEYADENFSVSELATRAEMSEVHFRRCFKQIYHVSPQQYLLELRLNRAKELLQYDTLPMTEVAQICGMPDPCYFSRLFKKKTGYAPSEYRTVFGTPHPD